MNLSSNRTRWIGAIAAVLAFVVLPIYVAAQAPEDPTVPGWVQWLSGFLQNPITLLVAGFIMARFPVIREKIANRAINYIRLVIAFLGTLLGFLNGLTPDPTAGVIQLGPAQALAGPLAVSAVAPGVIAGFSFLGLGGGILGCIGQAAWQVVQAHLGYRIWIRKQIGPDPKDSLQ